LTNKPTNEAGALQYDWFLNEDETACIVHEQYQDSAAVLAHVAILGALFGTLPTIGRGRKFEVFGNRTSGLQEATSGFDLSVFPTHRPGK
jgi:hypothetical protein